LEGTADATVETLLNWPIKSFAAFKAPALRRAIKKQEQKVRRSLWTQANIEFSFGSYSYAVCIGLELDDRRNFVCTHVNNVIASVKFPGSARPA
jgi:hypothetical protein